MSIILISVAPMVLLLACCLFYNFVYRPCAEVRDWRQAPSPIVIRERQYDEEYSAWRRALESSGEMVPIDCPEAKNWGERCFAFCQFAHYYQSALSWRRAAPNETLEPDVAVFDGFGPLRLVDRGSLCVTERRIYFKGKRKQLVIPFAEIENVDAENSGLMLGLRDRDKVEIFDNINGRLFCDVIKRCLGEVQVEEEGEPWPLT